MSPWFPPYPYPVGIDLTAVDTTVCNRGRRVSLKQLKYECCHLSTLIIMYINLLIRMTTLEKDGSAKDAGSSVAQRPRGRVGGPEPYLTCENLAAYLRLNVKTEYRLTKAGKIPAVRVGQRWRFRKSQIDAWLQSHNAQEQ